MIDWVECPSRRMGCKPILLGNFQAQCPICDFTFSTVMDEPVLPRHWISRDGELVRLGPEP